MNRIANTNFLQKHWWIDAEKEMILITSPSLNALLRMTKAGLYDTKTKPKKTSKFKILLGVFFDYRAQRILLTWLDDKQSTI